MFASLKPETYGQIFEKVKEQVVKAEGDPLKPDGRQKKASVRAAMKTIVDAIDIPYVPNIVERPLKDLLIDPLIDALIDFIVSLIKDEDVKKAFGSVNSETD